MIKKQKTTVIFPLKNCQNFKSWSNISKAAPIVRTFFIKLFDNDNFRQNNSGPGGSGSVTLNCWLCSVLCREVEDSENLAFLMANAETKSSSKLMFVFGARVSGFPVCPRF